jgi:hypothetical protein
MNRTSRTDKANSDIGGPAAKARLDRQSFNRTSSGFSYRPHVAASGQLFATPPVDLTTLVIAQEIKRKAQAERQREVLRETAYQYDMPVRQERNNESSSERGGWTNPADFDE